MESNHNPFPWCGECGTWHAPDKHVTLEEREARGSGIAWLHKFGPTVGDELLRLQAENKALSSKLGERQWISVAERMPSDERNVLVTGPDYEDPITLWWFDSAEDSCWCDHHGINYLGVTHWMPLQPLPEPPK